MQPQPLTRVTGAVLGVRTVTIDAVPPSEQNPEGREASSWRELDVATAHARYNGELVTGHTAVLPVIIDDDGSPAPSAGEVVDLLVYPYATFRKYGNGPARKTVAHRFVAPYPADEVRAVRSA